MVRWVRTWARAGWRDWPERAKAEIVRVTGAVSGCRLTPAVSAGRAIRGTIATPAPAVASAISTEKSVAWAIGNGTKPAAPQARRISSWQDVSGPGISQAAGFEVTCYAMWSGTVFLLPLAPAAMRAAAAPPSALGAAIYLGLGPSALGFVTWGYAIARGSVARAAAVLYLVPPVAFLVAFAWLGEVPHLAEFAGGLLGVAGVTLVNRGGHNRSALPPATITECLELATEC